MDIMATRTVLVHGRLATQFLVSAPELGRGRSYWLGPTFQPDPAPAAPDRPESVEVVFKDVRRGRCSLVGLHGSRCHMAVEFGYCAGGCSDWLVKEAGERSGDDIAGAMLRRFVIPS